MTRGQKAIIATLATLVIIVFAILGYLVTNELSQPGGSGPVTVAAVTTTPPPEYTLIPPVPVIVAETTVVTTAPPLEYTPLPPNDSPEPIQTISASTGGYEFKSRIDLRIDLDAVKPSDVKQELSVFIQPETGGGGKGCLASGSFYRSTYSLAPNIIEETTSLHKRTLPPESRSVFDTPDICACGYEENEALNISLIDPFGEVMLEIEVAAVHGEGYYYALYDTFYCCIIYELSEFDFLPEDPLAEYTVEIASENAHLVHSFVLEELTSPAVYYSSRLEGFVVAGFEPFEEVQILAYKRGKFRGAGRLGLDESGVGLLTGEQTFILFVVRENLDFVIGEGPRSGSDWVLQPLDYDKIVELDPANANAYYHRGLYSNNSFDNRIGDFTRAIELDPDYLPAYEKRASLYEQQGNYDQAIADYCRIIELDPNSLSAFKERVRLHEKQGNYNQAIADYSRVIELDPDNLDGYYARAHLYDSLGDYGKALNDFTQAIALDYDTSHGSVDDYKRATELDPDYALAHYRLGAAYSKLGEDSYDQAIAAFTKVLELDPDSLDAYYARADCYHYHNYDRAIADYSKTIELDPDYLPAYYRRAQLHERQGHYDRAIADYSKVIELKPDYVPAYYAQARLCDSQGDSDKAIADLIRAIELDDFGSHGSIADYTKAIELAPNYALAYHRRGVAYSKRGNYVQAIADYNRAIELASDYATAYNDRGVAYYNLGDYDQAITDYTKAIELAPDYAIAYNNRGWVYHKQGKYDRAIADYTKAIELARVSGHYGDIADYTRTTELFPGHALAYYRRGAVYDELGDNDQAFTDYSKAIELDPNCSPAYFARGLLYDSQGNYAQAIADWERFLKWPTDEYRRKQAEQRLRELKGE